MTKGKRPAEDGGRGQLSKSQRTDYDNDRRKGKGTSSSSFSNFSRFREPYIPFLWHNEAHYYYDLYNEKSPPNNGVEIPLEKLK
jgi:hypothetical protein